jgi:hypothetical protein
MSTSVEKYPGNSRLMKLLIFDLPAERLYELRAVILVTFQLLIRIMIDLPT